MEGDGFLQPSGSSMATAIAAAYNIVRPGKQMGVIADPDGIKAHAAEKWAALVARCAAIIHSGVSSGQTGQTG